MAHSTDEAAPTLSTNAGYQQVVAGQAREVPFVLSDVLHTFKPGHRIMIQAQSSMFPQVQVLGAEAKP